MWHGFLRKFYVNSRHNSTWCRFGPNRDQILWIFHVIFPCFICSPCWNMTWILASSRHGVSLAFAKKMMGFPSNLISFSNQTKLPSKRGEKIPVTFFTGRDSKLKCVKINQISILKVFIRTFTTFSVRGE